MAEKKKGVMTSTLYTMEGDKLKRKNKFCPRCNGVFMAFHKKSPPRYACGKCGYTEFQKNKE